MQTPSSIHSSLRLSARFAAVPSVSVPAWCRTLHTGFSSILFVATLLTASLLNATTDTPPESAAATPLQEHRSAATLFAEALSAYEAQDYTAAAEQFARLADEHPTPAAYYNLGNAYFRLAQYGPAIAAYQKAHALAPAQPDIVANLERAQEAARVSTPPPSRWEQYARQLSPNTWTLLLVVSFWATLALWLIPALFRGPHGIWRPSLLVTSATVLALSAAGLYPWRQLSAMGTVLEPDAPLLLAPVSTSPVQSYAQAGQSAERIGSHGNFERIRLPDGSEGWINRSQFATTWQTGQP